MICVFVKKTFFYNDPRLWKDDILELSYWPNLPLPSETKDDWAHQDREASPRDDPTVPIPGQHALCIPNALKAPSGVGLRQRRRAVHSSLPERKVHRERSQNLYWGNRPSPWTPSQGKPQFLGSLSETNITKIMHSSSSLMNITLSQQRFWPCHKSGLIQTNSTINITYIWVSSHVLLSYFVWTRINWICLNSH